MDAQPPVGHKSADAQIIIIEDENLPVQSPSLKDEHSPPEFITDLESPSNDYEADDSSSEISIHVEGPVDESLSSSALTASSTQYDTDATPTEDIPGSRLSRVRFRSRVRITSGLHHHHRRRVSTSSSLTSSPSSSISAPLRSPGTETPGWGTLGQRVGIFAFSNKQGGASHNKRRSRQGVAGEPTERTSLLFSTPPSYTDGDSYNDENGESYNSESDEEAILSRQIDNIFGKWPGRLLNRHWWWWQLEPVLCCGCLDEPDED